MGGVRGAGGVITERDGELEGSREMGGGGRRASGEWFGELEETEEWE